MPQNLSIAGKLFGRRDPSTTVKRRIRAVKTPTQDPAPPLLPRLRNIRYPVTLPVDDVQRFGTPPQQPGVMSPGISSIFVGDQAVQVAGAK